MNISEALRAYIKAGSDELIYCIGSYINDRINAARLLGRDDRAKEFRIFENDLGPDYELMSSLRYHIQSRESGFKIIGKCEYKTDDITKYTYCKLFPCLTYDIKGTHIDRCEIVSNSYAYKNKISTEIINASIFKLVVDTTVGKVDSSNSVINECIVNSRNKNELDIVYLNLKNAMGNKHEYQYFGNNHFIVNRNVMVMFDSTTFNLGGRKISLSSSNLAGLLSIIKDNKARKIKKSASNSPLGTYVYIDKNKVYISNAYTYDAEANLVDLIDDKDLYKLVEILQSAYLKTIERVYGIDSIEVGYKI